MPMPFIQALREAPTATLALVHYNTTENLVMLHKEVEANPDTFTANSIKSFIDYVYEKNRDTLTDEELKSYHYLSTHIHERTYQKKHIRQTKIEQLTNDELETIFYADEMMNYEIPTQIALMKQFVTKQKPSDVLKERQLKWHKNANILYRRMLLYYLNREDEMCYYNEHFTNADLYTYQLLEPLDEATNKQAYTPYQANNQLDYIQAVLLHIDEAHIAKKFVTYTILQRALIEKNHVVQLHNMATIQKKYEDALYQALYEYFAQPNSFGNHGFTCAEFIDVYLNQYILKSNKDACAELDTLLSVSNYLHMLPLSQYKKQTVRERAIVRRITYTQPHSMDDKQRTRMAMNHYIHALMRKHHKNETQVLEKMPFTYVELIKELVKRLYQTEPSKQKQLMLRIIQPTTNYHLAPAQFICHIIEYADNHNINLDGIYTYEPHILDQFDETNITYFRHHHTHNTMPELIQLAHEENKQPLRL